MCLLNIHGVTPRGKYNSYKGDQNGTCKNLLLNKVVDEEKQLMKKNIKLLIKETFQQQRVTKNGQPMYLSSI